MEISAPVKTFQLAGKKRTYIDVSLPYREYRKFFRSNAFNALTGLGEQRAIDEKHARKLSKEMVDGNYTPTQRGACLRQKQRKLVKIEGGVATLELDENDPIPITDGQHRDESHGYTIESLPELREEVENLPVDVKIMLDGDPKTDFINHQLGKPVDKSHMFSLQVRLNGTPEKDFAWKVAKVLRERADSPFFNMVRLDSRNSLGLPVTTLCATKASDLSTSLIGLARVCKGNERSVEWAANCVIRAVQILKEYKPEILDIGKVLTPPPDGSKGSSTMLVGIGICLAYWLNSRAEDTPDEDTEKALAKAAELSMDRDIGSFRLSAQSKRELMNEFCAYFFEGWEGTKAGVPEELLSLVSPSAYNVTKG